MEKTYRWGIITAGKMSAKFAEGLKILEKADLYAVGSRDIVRSREFAGRFGFLKSYGSYEELATDPAVDIIYIASPHSHHHEHTMLCLKSGKHVICEKAFAINSREVEEMISEARRQNLFLMEALWPPFQPFYIRAKEILASGILGEIINMQGWFSFKAPYDPAERKFNLALGASSLLDIGIYPVIDALTFIGVPGEIKALATNSQTGSEESINVLFRYKNGKMANLYSSFRTNDEIGCKLLCEKGNLTVLRGRDMNQVVILQMHSGEREEFSFRPEAMGYHFEALEVMRCLDLGLKESPVVPLSFSSDLIRTLDRIREEAGIVLPGDRQ